MTVEQIQKLLAEKHSSDVYVSECKDGPTWFGPHNRLDGWAMKKSWKHPLTVGYEIKISRSDFLQDDKWRNYLPYCNEFYFVCPPKLIDPAECGDTAGLIYMSSTGSKLYTKKKAPYREINEVDLASLLKYILISRARITKGAHVPISNFDYWEKWLQDKNENKILGTRVKGRILERHRECVDHVNTENTKLKKENEALSDIKTFCEELGINYHTGWIRKSTVSKALHGDLIEIPGHARRLIRDLENMAIRIEEITK